MNEDSNRDVMVFTGAIHLPAGERAAYLERACGGDAELRQRIEALLQVHAGVGNFLEQPPRPVTIEAQTKALAGEKPGDRIDRYRLLQPIGEGGCGVVFLAEQEEPVRRQVALKIIKPGMDTKSVIARFEVERQSLALMDHPHIAKVFDAGATAAGRPYFVMELVRGVKITDYCDQHSLTIEERLKLFIQVCQAVQHAHQKGIIHRDIKPSNILAAATLQGTAMPVVIDFGIAKATTSQPSPNKTVFTAFEMLIGTPAYMSPEQAALANIEVDTRTDIYSLGVLLYELLTGSTPFDDGKLFKVGLDEIRRVIREQEPVRPSTRLRQLAGAILATAARHRQAEPGRLIQSISGDLDWITMKALEKDRTRRYETANGLALDIQRFLANEPIGARPPGTFYRFQKAVRRHKLLFTSIGLIALLLIVSLIVVSAALARERHSRHEAEVAVVDSQQVKQFLENMLQSVGPSVALGQDTTMLRGILDRTARHVGDQLTNQPAVEAELRGLIGRVYYELGNYEPAEKMQRTALTLSQKQFGANSPETAAALNDLGEALSREGNLAESDVVHLEALAIRRRLFGNTNAGVADSLNNLANTYRMQHRFAEADALTREALDIRQKLFGDDSLAAADSLRNLSILLADEGRPVEAEATTRKVLAIRQFRLGREGALVASTLDDVAWAAGNNGKINEAESLEAQSLAMKRKVLGDEHPDVARSLFLLGQRLQAQGKLTDSAAMLSAALSVQRKLLGDENPDTLYTLRNLSWVLEQEGDLADAEIEDRLALASWRKLYGNESDQALSARDDLVRVLVTQKKLGEAGQFLDEALTPAFVSKPASVKLLIQRCDLMGRQGRWPEAAADAALVLEYQPTDHYRYHTLAALLAMIQNHSAYEQLCRRIQANFPDTSNAYLAERVSKDCLLLPPASVDMSWVDKMADTAITCGNGDPSMPFFQTARALTDYRLGHFARAIEWAGKALNSAPVYEQAHAHAYAILALAHWQLGEKDQAQAALARGNQLTPLMSSGHGPVDVGSGWVAWLMARISLDEAAALIQPASPAGGNALKP